MSLFRTPGIPYIANIATDLRDNLPDRTGKNQPSKEDEKTAKHAAQDAVADLKQDGPLDPNEVLTNAEQRMKDDGKDASGSTTDGDGLTEQGTGKASDESQAKDVSSTLFDYQA